MGSPDRDGISLLGFCHFGETLWEGTAGPQSSVFSVKPLIFGGQISKRVKTSRLCTIRSQPATLSWRLVALACGP